MGDENVRRGEDERKDERKEEKTPFEGHLEMKEVWDNQVEGMVVNQFCLYY